MSNDDWLKRLRERAIRALGNSSPRDAVATFRAIIGPTDVPAGEELAQAALDKLRDGEVPNPEELTALETVVRLLRPVLASRECAVGALPDGQGQSLYPPALRDLWDQFRARIQPWLCSVGRIENRRGEHRGTGFLVGDGVLATNRHVLAALSHGAEVLSPGSARVVFRQEAGLVNRPGDMVPIEGILAVHQLLDVALLRVPVTGRLAVKFALAAAIEGTPVATIGYPAEDLRNNPLFLAAVFQGAFGVKRVAVGEVLDGRESARFYHDCSTTQGNSGSPVFALDSALLVGIHRSGFFMYRNEAVDVGELRAFVGSTVR